LLPLENLAGLAPLTSFFQRPTNYIGGKKAWNTTIEALGRLQIQEAAEPLLAFIKAPDQLDDTEQVSIQTAARALGELGASEALASLVRLRKINRVHSINEQLNQISPSETVRLMAKSIDTQDVDISRQAMERLGDLGAVEAGPILMQYLEAPHLQRSAMSALARLKYSAAIKPLTNLAKSADRNMRLYLVDILRQLEAESALINLLKDSDRAIHKGTIAALSSLDSPKVIEPFIAMMLDSVHMQWTIQQLENSQSNNKSQSVSPKSLPNRKISTKSISYLPSNRYLRQLSSLQIVKETEFLLRLLDSPNIRVRPEAVRTLGELGAWQIATILKEALKDPEFIVRRQTAEALGLLDSPESINSLIDALKDSDRYVRSIAASSLITLRATAAVDDLTRFFIAQSYSKRGLIDDLNRLDASATGRSIDIWQAQFFRIEHWMVKTVLGLDTPIPLVRLVALIQNRHISSARKIQAIKLIQKSKDKRLSRFLLRLLHYAEYEQNGFIEMQQALVQVLGTQGLPNIKHVLSIVGYKPHQPLRLALLKALGQGAANVTNERRQTVFEYLDSIQQRDSRREIQIAIAASRLAWQPNNEKALQNLHNFAASPKIPLRQQVAEVIGEQDLAPLVNILIKMLKDHSVSVRRSAATSLGQLRAIGAVQPLRLLLNPEEQGAKLKHIAIEALGKIATPELVPLFQTYVRDNLQPGKIRRAALQALENGVLENPTSVFAKSARITLLDMAKSDEEAIAFLAMRTLAKTQDKNLLPELKKRRQTLEMQYQIWRTIRDEYQENWPEEKVINWKHRIHQAKPKTWQAFPLAWSAARIDPTGVGRELLKHDLAAIRHGAWMGIAETGNITLLRELDQARAQPHWNPFFRRAAYRAIDYVLIRVEAVGDADDCKALQDWQQAGFAADPDGDIVAQRVAWTIGHVCWRAEAEPLAVIN
ncbi:MAG: HEAT repeat domain-containing protein, partial [Pseudomonadota bacterium]